MLEFTRMGVQEMWVAGSVSLFVLVAFILILLKVKVPAILITGFLVAIFFLVSAGYVLFEQGGDILKGHPVNEIEYLAKTTKPGEITYGFQALGVNWIARPIGKTIIVKSLQPTILIPYLEGPAIAKASAEAIAGNFKEIHQLERFRGAFNPEATKAAYNWVKMRALPEKNVTLKAVNLYVPSPDIQSKILDKLWPVPYNATQGVPIYWSFNPIERYGVPHVTKNLVGTFPSWY